MTKVEIYTDGACSGNPGPGGYAAILKYGEHERRASGNEENTTNNRMEIMAAIRGLRELLRPCEVTLYSDSQYLVQTMNNNWKRSKNVDLWVILDELCEIHKVEFVWVKGHASNPYNNECDKLARAEILKIKK